MTDQRQPPPPDEDFAAMFAASERDGKQTRRPALAIGDRVSGKVVSVGQEVTVLDLGRGGEGTLETLELRAPDGQLTVQVGDVLEARVVAHGDRPGFVSLRRGAGHGASGRTSLEEAAATGLPVEGIVTAVNKGGVEVDVAGTRAFCPLSQLELRTVADPAWIWIPSRKGWEELTVSRAMSGRAGTWGKAELPNANIVARHRVKNRG